MKEYKENLTQVTSMAQEAEKSGQELKLPSAEELVSRAGSSIISDLTELSRLIHSKNGSNYRISRKGMNRLLIAILSLPADEVPVMLQKDEKYAFALGQNVIRSLFIIMQSHVRNEILKRQQEQNKEGVENEQSV